MKVGNTCYIIFYPTWRYIGKRKCITNYKLDKNNKMKNVKILTLEKSSQWFDFYKRK